MKDRLSAAGADVEHGAVSVYDVALAPDLGRNEVAAADNLRVLRCGLIETGDVALWDNEHVGWRRRSNVLKGVNVFILIDLLRGNFSGDDSAKKTVWHEANLTQSSPLTNTRIVEARS